MNMCACIEHGAREARSSHIEAETDRAVWDGLLYMLFFAITIGSVLFFADTRVPVCYTEYIHLFRCLTHPQAALQARKRSKSWTALK